MFELDIVYIQPVSNHTHSVPLRFRLLHFWIQGLPYFFDFLGKLFCDSNPCTSEFSGIHSDVFPVLKIVEFHCDCSRLTVAITLPSDSVRSVYFNLLSSIRNLKIFIKNLIDLVAGVFVFVLHCGIEVVPRGSSLQINHGV